MDMEGDIHGQRILLVAVTEIELYIGKSSLLLSLKQGGSGRLSGKGLDGAEIRLLAYSHAQLIGHLILALTAVGEQESYWYHVATPTAMAMVMVTQVYFTLEGRPLRQGEGLGVNLLKSCAAGTKVAFGGRMLLWANGVQGQFRGEERALQG